MHWVLGIAAIIFLLKAFIIYGVGRLFGLNDRQAMASGISLAQVGEFSFVIAAAAHNGGILANNRFDMIVSVIIVLMFAAPYMVSYAQPMADALLRRILGGATAATLAYDSKQDEPTNMVLVVGLGPSGQEVVRHLKKRNVTPVVVDINLQSRKKADQLGVIVHLGDAVSEDVLLHAGFNDICMAVVTVPDPTTSAQIVAHMKGLRPQLPIAVRCRYHRHMETVKNAGATIIVDEEAYTGHLLAHQIIDFMQTESGETLACRLVGRPDEKNPTDSAVLAKVQ
jgi:CPA2 family monovalent cation:H+ antiporter-2